MDIERRLGRVASGLSARERVVLYVRSVLEDRTLDLSVRFAMPESQVAEANRLIRVANGILHVLLPQALVLQQEVQTLTVQYQLVLTLAAWGHERTALRNALSLLAVVPVPQSEYGRLQDALDAEHCSFAEAVGVVEGFADSASEAAAKRELKKLLRSGTVRSRGEGEGLEVEIGSLLAHYGEPLRPRPEGAWRYEPVPDEEYGLVQWRVDLTRDAFRGPIDGPGRPPVPLVSGDGSESQTPSKADVGRDQLARHIQRQVRECWARLLAVETVTAEAVETLGDPAVVPESMTSLLTAARSGLDYLYSSGADTLPLDPRPVADPELVEHLRTAMLRDETRVL